MRISTIHSCNDCPNNDSIGCYLTGYIIPEILEGDFPDWCPLEDYQGWKDKPDSEGMWWYKENRDQFIRIIEVWFHNTHKRFEPDWLYQIQAKWHKAIVPTISEKEVE